MIVRVAVSNEKKTESVRCSLYLTYPIDIMIPHLLTSAPNRQQKPVR